MKQPATSEPEAGRPPLERAVQELPQHEPAAGTWDRIAARLAADQALAHALPQLPQHEPAADTWNVIAARLDHLATPVAPRPHLRVQRRRAWQLALVASLLLVAGLGWLGRPGSHAPVAVAPPTAAPGAVVAPAVPDLPALPALPPPVEPLDTQGEAFIDAHCSSLPQVCQSGKFRQLRARLAALQQQQQQLENQTQQRGATPQLEQQQVQVTIQKATVTRELVHLLIS